jgi:hypothetical protein
MKRNRLKILYVDSKGMGRELAGALREAGFKVSAVPGPDGALERMTTRQSAAVVGALSPDEARSRAKRTRAGQGAKRPALFAVELARNGAPRSGRGAPALPGGVRMTLRALRDSVGKTQGEVAREISMTQPQLSRVEARRDHLISTLRKYVGALGGEIDVVAKVDGVRISLKDV